MRRENLLGALPTVAVPLPIEALRALPETIQSQGRYHFSLALAYLDSDSSDNAVPALAALDQAEALEFEAKDRLTLYKALCLYRIGKTEEAKALVTPLKPYELVDEENAFRDRILQHAD